MDLTEADKKLYTGAPVSSKCQVTQKAFASSQESLHGTQKVVVGVLSVAGGSRVVEHRAFVEEIVG